ncbi:MAG: twin-arginine translocation signal domain-containing protein, partial [Gemmatimonadales bacterium]
MEASMPVHHQQVSPPRARCGGCGAVASRRDFLREAASVVACATALGAPGSPLGFTVRLTGA